MAARGAHGRAPCARCAVAVGQLRVGLVPATAASRSGHRCRRIGDNRGVASTSVALQQSGFVWIESAFATPAEAFARSQELIDGCTAVNGGERLSVIGEFVLPPPAGKATRDFQTLHFDFGLPLNPQCDQDVARYTALFVPRSARGVTAVTRLVPLETLLGQRPWPDRTTLLGNLVAYGESHGAWDDAEGYSEGSLARVVEAAAGTPRLPSVKSTPGFLCGMEFDTLAAEMRFFTYLGLDVEDVQIEVPLRPGDLLVFDNLTLAHGRRGSRRAGELHQRVHGHRLLSQAAQRALRDRFLATFEGRRAPLRLNVSSPHRDGAQRHRPEAQRFASGETRGEGPA